MPLLTLLPLLLVVAACKAPPPPTGFVMIGASPEGFTGAELWSPRKQCLLPSLTRLMFSPTLDAIRGRVIACDGDSCSELKKKPANEIADEAKALKKLLKKRRRKNKNARPQMPLRGRWETLQNTSHWRVAHTSAITPDGILLVGGSGSPDTTELIPVDGSPSREGFPLDPGRQFHCSIQVSETTIVLTGGLSTEFLVTEHSQLEDLEEVVTTELANLTTGRYYHACGIYTVGEYESQVGSSPPPNPPPDAHCDGRVEQRKVGQRGVPGVHQLP